MNLEMIKSVFKTMDKELLSFLTEEEYEEHVNERAREFWLAREQLTKDSIYDEFMAK